MQDETGHFVVQRSAVGGKRTVPMLAGAPAELPTTDRFRDVARTPPMNGGISGSIDQINALYDFPYAVRLVGFCVSGLGSTGSALIFTK